MISATRNNANQLFLHLLFNFFFSLKAFQFAFENSHATSSLFFKKKV